MCTQWVFRGCSHSLIGIHVHSQVFKGCSLLTHWCSCALTSVQGVFSSDTGEIFLMVAAMVSHVQQWVFTLTYYHSCTLNGCSGDVQYSLIGVHSHSQEFWRCPICVQPGHVPECPMNTFSNLQSTQRPYNLALNFHSMSFLWLCQARIHYITLHD
jgi:hypothetical protein